MQRRAYRQDMPDPLRPLFEFGILGLALLLAAFAMLFQRRPEVSIDWPPSPPPPPYVRRDLIVISASVMLLVAGIGMGAIGMTITVVRLMVS